MRGVCGFWLFLAGVGVGVGVVNGLVNLGTTGDHEYCNKNPGKHSPNPLSASDASSLQTMRQLQVFFRHGARASVHSMRELFPNIVVSPATSFFCNITTATHRHTGASVADDNTLSLRKRFVAEEQVIEGNCEKGQSLPVLVEQHTVNAEMVRDAYVGDRPGASSAPRVFTDAEWTSLRDTVLAGGAAEEELSVKMLSTNKERTLSSAAVFLSSLFETWDESVEFLIETHDTDSDPLRAYSSKGCQDAERWLNDTAHGTDSMQDLLASNLMINVKLDWYEETGSDFVEDWGITILSPYCAGLDIPISEALFLDAVNASYQYVDALHHNGKSSPRGDRLVNGPLAQYIADNLRDAAKMVLYSFHDTSLLIMLEALGIFDGVHPVFAEMVILEVYQNKSGIEVFRWLRNGEFVPFPDCPYLDGTELCDLAILNASLASHMSPLKTWEPVCASTTEEYYESLEEEDEECKKNSRDRKYWSTVLFVVGVGLGFMFGMFVTWLVLMRRYRNAQERAAAAASAGSGQQFLSHSSSPGRNANTTGQASTYAESGLGHPTLDDPVGVAVLESSMKTRSLGAARFSALCTKDDSDDTA